MKNLSRRQFLTSVSMLDAGTALTHPAHLLIEGKKMKVALIGTGIRGISFWGKRLVDNYGDILEFVGLSDINASRLAMAKKYIGADCPTFADNL